MQTSYKVFFGALFVVVLPFAFLIVIAPPSSAQGPWTPNPTITSVTISGTQAVVDYTIPSGEGYNWAGVAHDSTLVETDGTLADDYAECLGSEGTSCTISGIQPGANYFLLQTQITTASTGCAPPAGQESSYPNGTGYCDSNIFEVSVGSSAATTTTTSPPSARLPGDSAIAGISGTVEVRQADGSWVQVANGAALHLGQEMRTGTAGKCTLTFADSTQIQLGYNSSFTPVQNTSAVKSSGSIVVDFISGILRWTDPGYVKGYFGKLKVRYTAAVLGVRGTDFVISRSVGTQAKVSVAVHQGRLTYTPKSGKALTLSAGTLVLLYSNGTASRFKLTNSDWHSYVIGA